MIEARSLSETYGDKTAVDDVSFTVRPGIATTLFLTIPAVLIAFLVGQAILSSQHIQASFSDPGVARAVVGAALYLTVVGILGLGLGALVRSTAGGIAALFGLLFALPIIVHFLPKSFSTAVDKYLPSSAGQALLTVRLRSRDA